MPRIPLIEDLTSEGVPNGSNLLVEFDPASQWYNASVTIAAGWISSGGKVAYNVAVQPPLKVRMRLEKLGLDPDQLEESGTLRLFDWYTATLGKKSSERFAQTSLRVADMSIQFAQDQVPGPPIPEFLGVMDNASVQARFNDEKAWIEFALTRAVPSSYTRQSTTIDGILKGAHSTWAYTQLESAYDAIIDFKLEEEGRTTRDLMRIRSMRDVLYNREWHELTIDRNLQVSIRDATK